MDVTIVDIGPDALPRYAAIPIAFRVASVLNVEVVDGGLGGFRLREEPVDAPYVKDYDACNHSGPENWPQQFDLRNWAIFLARAGDRDVGGAAVAFDTPGLHMLEDRHDVAVLWDIRVQPQSRGCGVGAALVRRSADWARGRGFRVLKIETQNVNVPACRFYLAQGAELGAIHRFAYASHPQVGHEAMLLWYLRL